MLVNYCPSSQNQLRLFADVILRPLTFHILNCDDWIVKVDHQNKSLIYSFVRMRMRARVCNVNASNIFWWIHLRLRKKTIRSKIACQMLAVATPQSWVVSLFISRIFICSEVISESKLGKTVLKITMQCSITPDFQLIFQWSAIPHKNQYFVLRGALKYFKWSAFQKSLGTTDIGASRKAPYRAAIFRRKIKTHVSYRRSKQEPNI
jgi:hypothetical protein